MENKKVKMRRRDREITDNEKIKEIIKACDCCRLGLNDCPIKLWFHRRKRKLHLLFSRCKNKTKTRYNKITTQNFNLMREC